MEHDAYLSVRKTRILGRGLKLILSGAWPVRFTISEKDPNPRKGIETLFNVWVSRSTSLE